MHTQGSVYSKQKQVYIHKGSVNSKNNQVRTHKEQISSKYTYAGISVFQVLTHRVQLVYSNNTQEPTLAGISIF